MNPIARKLHSRHGASMLIALVFMLFCVFVGGSVLTAATANGSRVAHLADQQDFLNQRSAALLLSDELAAPEGKILNLMIYDDSKDIQKGHIGNGGVWVPVGAPITQRTIVFRLPAGIVMTPFQRIMVELTIHSYLRQTGGTTNMVKLENFQYQEKPGSPVKTVTKAEKLWFQMAAAEPLRGTAEVKVTTSAQLAAFTTRYHVGEGEDLYDFLVDFGPDSQLTIRVNAVSSAGSPIVTTHIGKETVDGTVITAKVTTTSSRPIISWQKPAIEKGGAV